MDHRISQIPALLVLAVEYLNKFLNLFMFHFPNLYNKHNKSTYLRECQNNS